jgi:hypothetical protein
MHLIIILHIHHTCMSIRGYVGFSHHSFFLSYTVCIHWYTATSFHILHFRNIVLTMVETCRVYNKQVNVRAFMLLYCSDNHWRHLDTLCLLQVQAKPRAHCNCFLHYKSTSCTHKSLPTLQIYPMCSHVTFFAPNVTPALTCFYPNLKTAVYSWLFHRNSVTFLSTHPIYIPSPK